MEVPQLLNLGRQRLSGQALSVVKASHGAIERSQVVGLNQHVGVFRTQCPAPRFQHGDKQRLSLLVVAAGIVEC